MSDGDVLYLEPEEVASVMALTIDRADLIRRSERVLTALFHAMPAHHWPAGRYPAEDEVWQLVKDLRAAVGVGEEPKGG